MAVVEVPPRRSLESQWLLSSVSCLAGVVIVVTTLPPRFLAPFLVLPGRFCIVVGVTAVIPVGSGVVLVVPLVLGLPGFVWSRLGALELLWRWWRRSCHHRHCGGSCGGGSLALAITLTWLFPDATVPTSNTLIYVFTALLECNDNIHLYVFEPLRSNSLPEITSGSQSLIKSIRTSYSCQWISNLNTSC